MVHFIGIGAQKAGTTWLFERLNEHPDVRLFPIKELHYFDRDPKYPSYSSLSEQRLIDRLKDRFWLRNAFVRFWGTLRRRNLKEFRWLWRWYLADYTDEWYISLFEDESRVAGEITPAYALLEEEEIHQMHRLAPNVRLVMLLRNPIERAWSQYRYFTRMIDDFDIADVDDQEIIAFMDRPMQTLRGDYLGTLRRYGSVFQSSQILVGFYDAIQDQPKALIDGILEHIGVANNGHLRSSQNKVVNRSKGMEMPLAVREHLHKKYADEMKEMAELIGGYCVKWYEKEFGSLGYLQSSHPSAFIHLSGVDLFEDKNA